MKKVFVLGVLASAVVYSSVASANSGTINFTGTITSATCTISPVVGGNSVASSIDLGNPGTDLTGAKTVPFSLKPVGAGSSDCLAKTQADVSWSAAAMDPVGLANSGGSATGVSLELKATNAANGAVTVTDSNRTVNYGSNATGAAKLTDFQYEAKLIKTINGGTVTAGDFKSSASYTVAYK